ELIRRPLLGAHERDPDVDPVEELGAALRADEDLAQLTAAVVELGGKSEIRRQLDTELGYRRAKAEFDDARGSVAEHIEISARGGAVERPLFGFELARFDERFGARSAGLRLREPRVGLDAIGDREAHVGRLVRVSLASADLVCEAPATHLVGSA